MTDFKFIPQYKGKDLDKVVKSELQTEYYAGIKYDGNYVQIHKKGDKVIIFTSGGKAFRLLDLEAVLVSNNPNVDFILEAEYIGNTSGTLGSRGLCTTTTWRTEYKKGIASFAAGTKFKVFDILYLKSEQAEHIFTGSHIPFETRQTLLLGNVNFTKHITPVVFTKMSLDAAQEGAKLHIKNGWEGFFLFHPLHIIKTNGRSNLAIKVKYRPTAELLCIGVTEGEGKYAGMIGSLLLVDVIGRTVSVGSGLSDYDRAKDPGFYIDKFIKIEYEQILDTYIQPTIVPLKESN